MRSIIQTAVGRVFFVVLISGLAFIAVRTADAQDTKDQGAISRKDGAVTILVTVKPHDERTRLIAERLQPTDFAVFENKERREIIWAKRAEELPLDIAILIQDDLVARVNNELRAIKDFIRELPEGSRVMTGYISGGTIDIRQKFTKDRELAADSLRIVISSAAGSPYNPYSEVIEAAREFRDPTPSRKLILMVSDGLDVSRGFRSASPSLSVDLDRAIEECQRRGISVLTFYSPSVGLTSYSRLAVMFGQGSLNKLADETGGEAFFSGTDFVTFNPYFRDLEETMAQQWLVRFRSEPEGKAFRRLEVETDFDLDLHYPSGYRTR